MKLPATFKAFTLLEMLAGMTIAAMVVLLGFYGIQLTMQQYHLFKKNTDIAENCRHVEALLWRSRAFALLELTLMIVGLFVLVLWLQEGIFKTWQSRLGERLVQLEGLIAQDQPPAGAAFQLHSGWMARRAGARALLAEYAASAARPTVAFPYVVLLLVLILLSQG